jgi:ankyrin repeat protein
MCCRQASRYGMSLRIKTRIRGLTTWVNFRLQPQYADGIDGVSTRPLPVSSVLTDLMAGTNLKRLVYNLTGNDLARLESFDSITQVQKVTRIQMAIDEFRKRRILPDEAEINARLVEARNAEHVFELLWQLVCYDIRFLAGRVEFLRQADERKVCSVAFRWIPAPVPVPPTKRKVRVTRNLMAGFGSSSTVVTPDDDDPYTQELNAYVPFPNDEIMTSTRLDAAGLPATEDMTSSAAQTQDIILEMVVKQLETVPEGRKLRCQTLGDLADVRVLSALVNSFEPSLFPSEVLLDDRWAINLILRTAGKILRMPISSFDVEDLVEADAKSVCSYFCAFFMRAYQFRQCMAVARQVSDLRRRKRYANWRLDDKPTVESSPSPSDDSSSEAQANLIRSEIDAIDSRLAALSAVFDVEMCLTWASDVETTVQQTRHEIREKMRLRFDEMIVGREATVDELARLMKINRSLSDAEHCYYLAEYRETVKGDRKVVVFDKRTGSYVWRKQSKVRKLLGLDDDESDVVPGSFQQLSIYVEVQSRHRRFKPGSRLLYQIFPTEYRAPFSALLRAAIKQDDREAVDRLTTFFADDPDVINCRSTGNVRGDAALHIACRLGRLKTVERLLERGADVDAPNEAGDTPLHCACDAGQSDVACLLMEWGCDADVQRPRGGETAFEMARSADVRNRLTAVRDRLAAVVPQIVDGEDADALERFVEDHVTGTWPLTSVRSRCIDGSTLLHSAVYFGRTQLARKLLALPGIDARMRDYRGATALHRARCADTVRLLIEEGAEIDAVDVQGNTPLHVKAYGEPGRPSELDAVRLLVAAGAKLDATNGRRLTPLHCAAMQGRIDVIEHLLAADVENLLRKADAPPSMKLRQMKRVKDTPPSSIYLAVVNDFVDCAIWLIDHGFAFHSSQEPDRLLRKLVEGELNLSRRLDVVRFLIDRGGADPNRRYPLAEGDGSRTLLHVAVSVPNIEPQLLALLVERGANLEAADSNGETPLHAACRADYAASAAELMRLGASIYERSSTTGETPLDGVADVNEWIRSGLFDAETVTALKSSGLRRVRKLIRSITKKVRPHERRGRHNGEWIVDRDRVEAELMNRLNNIESQETQSVFSKWCRSRTGVSC